MLSVSNLSVQFGKRVLFDEVNTIFTQGNCYGIIGANGSGKSTFLKILSGDVDPTSGSINLEKGKRMSVLSQDHFAFDESPVLETVMIGNKPLFDLKKKLDEIYAKPDFSEESEVTVLKPVWDEAKCTGCGKCAEACNYNAIAVIKNKVFLLNRLVVS